MCFFLDSWMVARVLNLRKRLKPDEKITYAGDIAVIVKKSWLEKKIEKLMGRSR